jgi:uncharacterized protein YggU (UPF0235/DUF167 family)
VRVRVTVKPGAREDAVSRRGDGSLLVSVRARARDGEANEAVVRTVARHLRVPQSAVRIASGQSGRHKTLEVPDGSFGPSGTAPIAGG